MYRKRRPPVRVADAFFKQNCWRLHIMAVTAKDVQALREMTGVGMMDCKKALTEANGDMD